MVLKEKAPAYQRYAKQILGDDICLAMEMDSYGMHNLLLDISWQQTPQGSIPDDNAQIRRWLHLPPGAAEQCLRKRLAEVNLPIDLCRCSECVWRRVWPQINPAWPIRDGRRFNSGMVRAAERSRIYRANASSKSEAKDVAKREQCYEEEDVVTIPVVVSTIKPTLEYFDGQVSFEEFCSIYPEPDRSNLCQTLYYEAVESEVKRLGCDRAVAAKGIELKTGEYLLIVPPPFRKSMSKYLSGKVFQQDPQDWKARYEKERPAEGAGAWKAHIPSAAEEELAAELRERFIASKVKEVKP